MPEWMPESTAYNLRTAMHGKKTEMCGFILDDWSFALLPNVAERPETSFFMDPQAMLEFVKENRERIIGVFHSHPRGAVDPSPDDLQGWHPNMPWRYFIVTANRVFEYEREGDDVTCSYASQ